MIEIGGYRLHLYCTGESTNGSPTVIPELGLGGASPPKYAGESVAGILKVVVAVQRRVPLK